MVVHELTVVDKEDPLVQIKFLNKQINVLLLSALTEMKGLCNDPVTTNIAVLHAYSSLSL